MTIMYDWRFPKNNDGEYNGINVPGMEYFEGRKIKSLAREIVQNALDAGVVTPVIVEFEEFEIRTDTLPGVESLKFAFERSLEKWTEQNDQKAKNFFKNAIELVEDSSINMLRISDFNTCGLTGSQEDWNTNWSNLVKGSGSSDKNGTAGGSFGIGKFAPFVCSDFRTVFYSTVDK